MSKLNVEARYHLRSAGVSQADWARRYFTDAKWHGDVCGCPDDRCIGYHHEQQDECGCLTALLIDVEEARR